MKLRLTAILLCLVLIFTGCNNGAKNGGHGNSKPETQGNVADLGDDNKTFGEKIENTDAYDGYFEGESKKIEVECISGTKNAYKLEGNTLTFTAVNERSAYSISGTFKGNIIIDVGDAHKFDLELHGLSLVSDSENPIIIISGDEVAIKAKKSTKNYIYDMRPAIDPDNNALYAGAIHSFVDLEIGGKGELTVVSENNNGIQTKDDLQVKNLTLFVACTDNALKGNDSVEIENAGTTLIASRGDCIKTQNSGISEKGNQRGAVSITGGIHTLYAASDGIDSAYNVTVDGKTTVLNIYTDKYSNYSKDDSGVEGSDMERADKSEHSAKGISAANETVINNGTVSIKSFDDAIYASNDTSLENGKTALGNVTIKGGAITVYSNNCGLHADGTLSIKGGTVTVSNAKKGIAGGTVNILVGYVSVNSKDYGINATATSGTSVSISGGTLYIYCSGNGIHSSSSSSYEGISFSGGRTVIITNSDDCSAIASKNGYKYSGGYVVAIMPSGSASNDSTQCKNFSDVGEKLSLSLKKGSYLTLDIEKSTVTVKAPSTFSSAIVVLGDTSPSVKTESSSSLKFDSNGVAWN